MSVSDVRVAVRIINSSARAATPSMLAQVDHEVADLGVGQGGVMLDLAGPYSAQASR